MKISPSSKKAHHTLPLAVFVLLLHLHLVFAILHNIHSALPLLIIFGIAYCFLIQRKFLHGKFEEQFNCIGKSARQIFQPKLLNGIKIAFASLLLIGFIVWLLIDSTGNRIRLRSLLGFFTFLCLCFSISIHPLKVKWQPIIGGIILQIFVGLFLLRWPPGTIAFQKASEKVLSFLEFSSNGTRFVYGFVANPPNICGMAGVLIFTALQIIVYFGAIVAVFYHFGIMQYILSRLAIVVHCTIGTTTAESMNAAACIFLGQTESAILIGPSIATMTDSEVHCIMTTGFACIAGSLFAAYIAFGACPVHLLSATIMNACISLAVSKLVYPELEESRHGNLKELQFAKREKDKCLLECISKAAVQSARFVLAIGANLVVYIALLALLNSLLGWAGTLVGIEGLSFNKLLSFVFFPLAWAMGASDAEDFHVDSKLFFGALVFQVSMDETMKVAELMGVKTMLNEFIAYQQLHQMIANGTLKGLRARMIATYALCGFSNFSTIGSQIGVLSAICPEKKSTFAKVALRALAAGVFSCFLTACVAGMLVDTPVVCQSAIGGAKCLAINELANSTNKFFN